MKLFQEVSLLSVELLKEPGESVVDVVVVVAG
jgi:hypothetical protein